MTDHKEIVKNKVRHIFPDNGYHQHLKECLALEYGKPAEEVLEDMVRVTPPQADHKEIEIQGAERGREHDQEYYYWLYIGLEDCKIYLASGDRDAYFDTPEQIDEIIKALQEAKTWLK